MYILFIILIVLFCYLILLYNKIIHLKKIVENSRSGMDVYLQQRFDLIPNLIEITKEYMEYENDILQKITKLRTTYQEFKDSKSISALNHQYQSILCTIENYPILKASESFLNLQKNLIKIESQLQASRRIYNNDVTKYNAKINTFPNSIITSVFGFTEFELFILEGESKN